MELSDKNQVELIGTVSVFKPSSKYLAVMSLATGFTYQGSNSEIGREITWHRVVTTNSVDIKAFQEAMADGYGKRARVIGRLRAVHYVRADESAVDTYEIVASSVEAIDVPGYNKE